MTHWRYAVVTGMLIVSAMILAQAAWAEPIGQSKTLAGPAPAYTYCISRCNLRGCKQLRA